MRELNRSGVLTKLEALDTKYLQKIFVGGGPRNRDIELSAVNLYHLLPLHAVARTSGFHSSQS